MRFTINEEFKIGVFEIEKSMVERFNKAVSYPRTLNTQIKKANAMNGILNIQLPTFIMTLGWGKFLDIYTTLAPSPGVHGSTEFEYYRPIKIGDVLSVTSKLIRTQMRVGNRAGKMNLDTFELFYTNQMSELAAKSRMTFIRYRAEEAKIG